MISIGLMSGTSLDGIDAALVETDGEKVISFGASINFPYSREFRKSLRKTLNNDLAPGSAIERDLTMKHAEAVFSLLDKSGLKYSDIGVVGFHGQTIFHDPANKITCQIGDGKLLANTLGIVVINDFRSNDVKNGGEGAPLTPIFHFAVSNSLERPLCILNLGGIANVTWIGSDGRFLAFDTGPANAPIDDWIYKHRLGMMDKDGTIARSGKVNKNILARLLMDDYFSRDIPKSLDRNYFNSSLIESLSVPDGAATLTSFSAAAVGLGLRFFPETPCRWLVTGGGRHNSAMMLALRSLLATLVEPVENVGWNGDSLEAQAFAYLAVRSILNLPISFPKTTGVQVPVTGGTRHNPE